MERLMVRFADGLPCSIRRPGEEGGTFRIPKSKRLRTLQYMTRRPQHVLKKRKSSWEVVGIPPLMSQKGGDKYGAFLRDVKKVFDQVPGHHLAGASLADLQKHPRIKELYERQFKNNPEFVNYPTILNAVASSLLNYDSSTGLVRDSVADVRKKKQVPPSTVPLTITKENDLDRTLLLAVDQFLARNNVPPLFLKSVYFSLRPQLQQLYSDSPRAFRGQLEGAREELQGQILTDYTALVNETNRIYLSRYPFQAVAHDRLGLTEATRGFARYRTKLAEIRGLTRTIPGSQAKFDGLDDMAQTYTRSQEAKIVSSDHFLGRIQSIMTNDEDFVRAVLRDGNHSLSKVKAILRGNSL